MNIQTIFERYEMKFILTKQLKEELMELLEEYMSPDPFGEATIRNLYFDTDTYRLIRRSIEKPVYREKLRLRSYSQVSSDDSVFVELKKKYRSVVYKRRLILPEREAMDWLNGGICPVQGQIASEIDYFYHYYDTLHPVMYISYDRQAFYSESNPDFRISFDDNILSRQDDLSLTIEPNGTRLLDSDHVIMEVKTMGGIPLWLAHFLTEKKLYKTPFSKYGTAYREQILPYKTGTWKSEYNKNPVYEEKRR
ncbi:MAG: polyphosphate polymerase domain-containing protein [Lachnospiraceae bacterium]|nr:polyphosphate polymerase domain-containing protein [Lachnospiraceae bacterium]